MCATCTSHGYCLRVVFISLRNFQLCGYYPRVASDQGNTVYTYVITIVLYSGKLLRKKTFANFEVLWLFMKFFFVKFGGVAIFGATSEQSPKIFSAKILLSSKVFFRESFPLHGSMNCSCVASFVFSYEVSEILTCILSMLSLIVQITLSLKVLHTHL